LIDEYYWDAVHIAGGYCETRLRDEVVKLYIMREDVLFLSPPVEHHGARLVFHLKVT
jgi:hypothetical protein